MNDKSEASTTWKFARAVYLAMWLGSCTFAGLGLIEFGMTVDGLGHGYLSTPTSLTVLLILSAAGTGSRFIKGAYLGSVDYTRGFVLGILFGVAAAMLGGLLAGWHYQRVCATRGIE